MIFTLALLTRSTGVYKKGKGMEKWKKKGKKREKRKLKGEGYQENKGMGGEGWVGKDG